MIVIIPFCDDHHNGEELRFAIRSMEKHFTCMEGVVVVGHKPKWYKGCHIATQDISSRKEFSMYCKVILAAKEFGLKEWLYSTDDHFCLQDFDQTLPNYYEGTCKHMALENSSGRYRMQYRNCPENWLNYDIHCPIVMKSFAWGSNSKETDRPIKTNYANQMGLPGTELKDLKFKKPHSYEEIKEQVKGKPFFSTSPFCMNGDMIKVLNELYPKKSIYEC